MNDYSQASSLFDSDAAGAADQPMAKPNGKDHTAGDYAADDPRTEALAEIADEIAAARRQWGSPGVDDLIDLVQSGEMSFPAKQQAFRKKYEIPQKRSEKTRDKYRRALTSAINSRVAVAEKKAEAEKVPVHERHVLDLTPAERAAELARTERAAGRLLNCHDLLGEIARTQQELGVAGDPTPGVLAYLIGATRVLPRPASAAVRASSAAGKSFIVRQTLSMHPPAACYVLTSASPKALIYTNERFEHRIVFLFEATRLQTADDGDELAMLVRTLISEHCIDYETVAGGGPGKPPQGVKVHKDGPIAFVTTTTGQLPDEVETRLLSIYIPESEAQTRAVLLAQAEEDDRVLPDVTEWHALGRWLELTAPDGIVMPFGKVLARLIRYTGDARVHRDTDAMRALVRVHALMRAKFRQRDAQGRVVAEIADYEAILPLIAASVADANNAAVRSEVNMLVEAIRGRTETIWRDQNKDKHGNPPASTPTYEDLMPLTVHVSQRELGKELGCATSTVNARVSNATKRGLLINNESRKTRRMQLQLGDADAIGSGMWVFPSPARLRREMGFGDLDDEIEVDKEDMAMPGKARGP